MERKLLNDIFQWDVKNWSASLKLWEEHLPPNGKALAIGEREGGLSLWLAKKGLDVICTDLRDFPERTRHMHAEHKVDDKITYQNQDVLNLAYPEDHFDVVMFKSVIGALSTKENQQKAIAEIHRVLKPGGVLLFAENMRGTKVHQYLRKRFIRWNTYWRYLHYKHDLDLFKEFTQTEFRYNGCWALFGRSEKQRSALASVDSGLRFLTPHSWRYILIGACVK